MRDPDWNEVSWEDSKPNATEWNHHLTQIDWGKEWGGEPRYVDGITKRKPAWEKHIRRMIGWDVSGADEDYGFHFDKLPKRW
jgi:hypothetical protein